MADVTAKIELYHRLFFICLVLAVLSLVLALILFFVLDIRTVLGYLTGRSAKEKIREQETALLQEKRNPDADTEVLINSAVVLKKFTIKRELILIHTEEVI